MLGSMAKCFDKCIDNLGALFPKREHGQCHRVVKHIVVAPFAALFAVMVLVFAAAMAAILLVTVVNDMAAMATAGMLTMVMLAIMLAVVAVGGLAVSVVCLLFDLLNMPCRQDGNVKC